MSYYKNRDKYCTNGHRFDSDNIKVNHTVAGTTVLKCPWCDKVYRELSRTEDKEWVEDRGEETDER